MSAGDKAIQRMMDKWREDDRKLELEERDRARRSQEMKREGVDLLAAEDARVGVAIVKPSGGRGSNNNDDDGASAFAAGEGKSTTAATDSDDSDGEAKASAPAPYRDPSLSLRGVINRSPPYGMPARVTAEHLTIREMSKAELSMAFAWMFQDEEDYPDNPNKWWTRAAKGFMVGWEDGEGRLTGAFMEGIAFPVAFCITKTGQPLLIDAVGVRRCFRGMGIGKVYVEHFLALAEARIDEEDGFDWYEVEAVQNAIGFWTRMGFSPIPPDEMPRGRYKNKTCLMMRKALWDEEEELRLEAEQKAKEEAERQRREQEAKEEAEAAARHEAYLAKKREEAAKRKA